jgi:hypothetical protein
VRNVLTWKQGLFGRPDAFVAIFVGLAFSLLIEAFLCLQSTLISCFAGVFCDYFANKNK